MLPMRVALLRVGIDSGCGGIDGPLFSDRSFEYIPIPDSAGHDSRTYGNTMGRHGKVLINYFPSSRREAMADCSIHYDPEFSTFTYGDPTPPKAGLRKLEAGDLLIFYCGLKGYDFDEPSGLYIFGFFRIEFAGYANELSYDQIKACAENAHVRHHEVFEKQFDRLVLVKGSQESRLLDRAIKINVIGKDKSGKPLKILSPQMQKIFGDFDGKLSIQRSPTRWVHKDFCKTAESFMLSL
jgi:hypothetical protein